MAYDLPLGVANNAIPVLKDGDAPMWLESLMMRRVRVTTEDGRQFIGEAQCTDNVGLLLAKCTN
jgi:hypothetical protein